jgi:protein TonB
MAFACVLRKSLFVTLMLAIWTAAARGQAAGPNPTAAHSHVQLEAKPPDEPSSSSSPDVEAAPDAAPSTGAMPAPGGSDGDGDAPVAADAVAHPPEIETYVVPEYPPKARARGIEGRVLLMVIVDASGRVEDDIKVLDSIPMLDQAAIDAVRQWSFTPGRDADGDPVRVQLEVPVRFTLR